MGDHHDSSSSSSFSPSNDTPSSSAPDSSNGAGAPMRVLVYLHKAFKGELDELRRLASVAAASGAECRRELGELRRRVEYFRSVYRYHCAAEIEVIFLALDSRVENVACTYYLQHRSIDSMFESVFSCLNSMEEPRNPCQELQDLIVHIGTLRDSIRQHMAKEEKQVFPLFMSNFSHEEQGSLVWQFISSLPVMLLEDLFPWLVHSLSPDEQLDLKCCIRNILPQDDSTLEEVVISWIEKSAQQPQGSCDIKYHTSPECRHESENVTDISKLNLRKSSPSSSCQWKEDMHIDFEIGPFSGLLLWHAAIRSDFKEILDKLDQKRSKNSSSLSSVVVQLNFLTEVLNFYSTTLEKIIYPMLEASHQPSLSYILAPHKKEVEELQKILRDAQHINVVNPIFLEMLCNKVGSLVLVTSEHLSFQEMEVFPLMNKSFNCETQKELLIKSLRTLPLGLLKCVTTWFSSHLPKDKLKSILHGIELSCSFDQPFISLLHEWAHIGYSGKTTTENLQEMLNRRVPYLSVDIREVADPCDKSEHAIAEHCPADSSRSSQPNSLRRSSGSYIDKLSSGTSNLVHSFSGFSTEVAKSYPEPRPMDHIYYFHKAIKKDLESLVVDTTKLPKNLGLVMEFSQHFCLVRSLYELHSEMEDKIAFPALEANPNARNLTKSYSIDHELEAECFDRVSGILDELSELYQTISYSDELVDPSFVSYHQLCLQLEDSCKSLKKILDDHILREETELWPLFREYFSIEEQEKLLGYMLGRTRAESLQKMIVWLMAHLTMEEQQAMMNFWCKATKYTKFDEWLGEWWEGLTKQDFAEVEESTVSLISASDPLRDVSKHLSWSLPHEQGKDLSGGNVKKNYDDPKAANMTKKMESLDVVSQMHRSFECTRAFSENREKRRKDQNFVDAEHSQLSKSAPDIDPQANYLVMSQVELEAAIRKVSQDSSLDLQEKSRVMQNLMTSHWVASQPPSDSDNITTRESGKLQGQFPSYRDSNNTVFGCKHYKQNCKLVATCCNRIFTCRRCHEEEVSEHVMERKSITHMMCMKCLEIQPIGRSCSTPSCNKFSMAKYYCRICKLFDDEREIYHCPYCNLCRVGKGLGIDYFHCMKCNACMGRFLKVHTCIEKCIEAKCPICQEDMFTSSKIIKSLVCGHVMHSECFEEYTCMRYTCPVCSKSLGNMQVYFEMLDALLAEEKMPDEYKGQTQAILCNDCEKKGAAPFHFLYHKCQFCGSYNTRLS